jgi:hypothetical protein
MASAKKKTAFELKTIWLEKSSKQFPLKHFLIFRSSTFDAVFNSKFIDTTNFPVLLRLPQGNEKAPSKEK